MDILNENGQPFETIKVRVEDNLCFIQLYRPEANNTINNQMLLEVDQLYTAMQTGEVSVMILEGLPETFCFGADFNALADSQQPQHNDPRFLYDLWYKIATGPYISVAHVRGKVNAGGVGFVAACDLVLADDSATFALSEMLFGLIPACVMPFLIRKVGFQKANFLTTTTQTIGVDKAEQWGLVDEYQVNSVNLLRKHLVRLRRLSKKTISRNKAFMQQIHPLLLEAKEAALATNLAVFGDQENQAAIRRYVQHGIFPWEK